MFLFNDEYMFCDNAFLCKMDNVAFKKTIIYGKNGEVVLQQICIVIIAANVV